MMPKQIVFKQAFVTELGQRVVQCANGKDLKAIYEAVGCDYDEGDTLKSVIEVAEQKPALSPLEEDDVENAIKIYEYLKIDSDLVASDRRLWTYLSHVDFRDYVQKRFPFPKKGDEKKYILEHWFHAAPLNPRSLRRNAIARLWWAAHLTCDPYGKDNEYYKNLKHKEDKYYYLKVLFATQDIYMTLLERNFGHFDNVLIAILEYIDMHPLFRKRRYNRDLAKRLNRMMAYKKVEALSFDELMELLNMIAGEILDGGDADEDAADESDVDDGAVDEDVAESVVGEGV